MKTKWIYLTMLIGCGGLFAVLSFGLTLAYLACNNNIVLYQSALPEIIDIFRDLFEILAWAIAFSMLTYAILYRLTKKTRLNLFALLGGILLLRRIFDLAVTLIMYRTISIYDDVIYNLIYWITDLLIVLFAWILTSSTANAYYRRRASKSKSKALFQDNAKIDASAKDFYPFQKIFTKENHDADKGKHKECCQLSENMALYDNLALAEHKQRTYSR